MSFQPASCSARAPVLVLAGVFTRPAALMMGFHMLAAVLLARRGDISLTISEMSGGLAIELELLFLLGAVAIALLGSGRYALRRDH